MTRRVVKWPLFIGNLETPMHVDLLLFTFLPAADFIVQHRQPPFVTAVAVRTAGEPLYYDDVRLLE